MHEHVMFSVLEAIVEASHEAFTSGGAFIDIGKICPKTLKLLLL
jgi:hypothetical protein